MRKILLMVIFIPILLLSKRVDPSWIFNEIIPFEEGGKWGLKTHGETILLPVYDSIKLVKTSYLGNFFIFTENGKEGVMNQCRILSPAIYEKIDTIIPGGNIIVYSTDSGQGINQLYPYRYLDSQGKEVEVENLHLSIKPNLYKGFFSNSCFTLCETHDGGFIIFDEYGNNLTPFYKINKLGGNIKNVINRKTPLSELKIKRSISDICSDFKKIWEKHPELNTPSNLHLKKLDDMNKVCTSNTLDTITYGPFKGIISKDGFISIPLEYPSPEDVIKRDPSNLYALYRLADDVNYNGSKPQKPGLILGDERHEARMDYAGKCYEFYNGLMHVYEQLQSIAIELDDDQFTNIFSEEKDFYKSLSEKYLDEYRSYGKTMKFTNTMNSIASSLMSIISDLQNQSDYTTSQTSSYSKSNNTTASTSKANNKYNINEQNNYNKDKYTYSRYESQLSSHFAGNQTMSTASIKNVQNKMRELRSKWEKKGKSFPHSPLENR